MGPDDAGVSLEDLIKMAPAPKAAPEPLPWDSAQRDAGTWAILDRWPDKYYQDGSLRSEGAPRATVANVVRVLEHDHRWNGPPNLAEKAIRVDTFRDFIEIRGEPLQATDPVDIAVWLDTVYQLRASPKMVSRVLGSIAHRAQYHPVRDYLGGLEWDREKRIHRLFGAYVGAEDTPLSRELGARWAISAVARIMRPGCKVDTAAVLVGKQGVRKSSLLEALAVKREWFSSTPFLFGTKDSYQQLDGVWLYELAELASLRPSGVEAVKAFLSQSVDRYRRSYGERTCEVRRQTIFVGSTNEQEFLHDSTGARRFWPVRVSRVDIDAVIRDRDQLWAEAMALFESGERWWLSEEWSKELDRDQQQHRDVDPWEEPIAAMLGGAAYRSGVTIAQVLTVGLSLPVDRQTRAYAMRAARIVQSLNWSRRRATVAGKREQRWFPPD